MQAEADEPDKTDETDKPDETEAATRRDGRGRERQRDVTDRRSVVILVHQRLVFAGSIPPWLRQRSSSRRVRRRRRRSSPGPRPRSVTEPAALARLSPDSAQIQRLGIGRIRIQIQRFGICLVTSVGFTRFTRFLLSASGESGESGGIHQNPPFRGLRIAEYCQGLNTGLNTGLRANDWANGWAPG